MDSVSLELRDVTKSFSGVTVLDKVSLEFKPGEVHALMGENGAGKSTLCKIVSGAYRPDSGAVVINGQAYEHLTPRLSKSLGIGMIYQEFNLVKEMCVYENIFLGKELRNGPRIDKRSMIALTRELFERLQVKIDPLSKIKDLSVAYCQLVEIAKTLQEEARVVIFDEPTAALTDDETDTLFRVIERLKADGLTIIYISHRMDEIEAITDVVTIMRDGSVIKTSPTTQMGRQEIISLMVGRTLDETFPSRNASSTIKRDGTPILEVRHLSTKKLKDISFSLYPGEILGLAGLVGSGRTEIMRALFGADAITQGEVFVKGERVDFAGKPAQAIKSGLALVPEDRKNEGLHLEMSISKNLTLAHLKELSGFARIDARREKQAVDDYVQTLSIKAASVNNPAGSLSGGNQQKVVISKWLLTEGDILMFDEPTRGIDVGAKKDLYELLDRLRKEGKAILMASSEMSEIVGMCDRVIVMYEGVKQGEMLWEDVTQESIMRLAANVVDAAS